MIHFAILARLLLFCIFFILLLCFQVTPGWALPSGLIGWWRAEGNANDSSGSGNNGTLVGGVTFAPGRCAQAFNFETPTTDAVNLPHTVLNGLTGVTFASWFRTTDVDFTLISGANQSSENEYTLHFFAFAGCDTGMCLDVFIKYGTANGIRFSVPVVNDGSFHHVAWVRHESGLNEIYLDGVAVGQGLLPAGPLTIDPNGLWLGIEQDCVGGCFEPGAGENLIGLLDEVMLYNRSLTGEEIQGILATGSGVECTLTVVIDIKPGSFPNSINLSSAGTIPVAIFSSATFDATQVNPETVSLAGAKVKLIGKADKYACSPQDVNADGRLDLVCHVVTAQFMIEPGDSIAILEADTFSGQHVRGEDVIQIVRD